MNKRYKPRLTNDKYNTMTYTKDNTINIQKMMSWKTEYVWVMWHTICLCAPAHM